MSGSNTFRSMVCKLRPQMMIKPDGPAAATAITNASRLAMVLPDRTAPCHRLIRAVARPIDRSCLRERGSASRPSTRPPRRPVVGLVGERCAQCGAQFAEHACNAVGVRSAFKRGELHTVVDGLSDRGDNGALIAEGGLWEVLLRPHVVFATERADLARREQLLPELLGVLVLPVGEVYAAGGEVDAACLGRGDDFGAAVER